MRLAKIGHLASASALAIVLAAVAAPALAQTEVCIESTSALYQAIADIDGGSTGAITLKLRAGTYTIGSDIDLDYRAEGDPSANYGKLSIKGGYNAGCSTRNVGQGATTLNASGGQRRIDIELIDNELTIDYVTTNGIDWSIGNWVGYEDEPGTIRFDHVRLLDTSIGMSLLNNYDVMIANSLFTARSGALNDAVLRFGAYRPDDAGFTEFAVSNSTFRGGGLRAIYTPVGAGHEPPFAQVRLASSVFENDGAEVVVTNADLYASHNRYDSLTLSGGDLASNLDNISAPAQLQSNHVPTNGSPLVNAGTRFVPGGLPDKDLAANPRQVGVDPDIGAYETAVNNSVYLDVVNTQSSGAGSLAQAIASANAVNGRQTIRFAISGACPKLITLAQGLSITDDTDILGETQAGTIANSVAVAYNGEPCIVIRAGNGVDNGLVFDSAEAGDNLKLSQVAFSGFGGTAVRLRSGSGHQLTGLMFGGTTHGTVLADVGTAIRVDEEAYDAQIGGPDVVQRNLVGNAGQGIVLADLGRNQVIGNAIGDSVFDPLPNGIGINISSPSNLVEDNFIARNSLNVVITGAASRYNTVRDNSVISAGIHGLLLSGGASRNRIGPENYFGGNGSDGIYLAEGSWNNLAGNTYSNNDGLAIDLGANGVNANNADPDFDASTSANRGQNFPELTAARQAPPPFSSFLILDGRLSSTRGVYRVEVYRNSQCDASGHGEGAVLLGSGSVDLDCTFIGPDNQCTKTFSLFVLGSVANGQYITATATDSAGRTSEFSACREVGDDRIFADDFD